MDAARLLYGELELDATSALFAVDQLDEGFDILADNINNSQESLSGLDGALNSSSESIDGLSFSFDGLMESLSSIGIFILLASAFYEIISSGEQFQKVLTELQKAFEPLLKVIAEFGEFIGKYVADVLLVAIGYLSTFINYLTKTEQGLALLKTAAIFTGIAITIALFPALKALAVAAYGALTALGALLVPLLPYIAIGAAVAAALTAVVLVLEDLYYFATGGKESAAGDFFESMGMSKKEIEEIRKSIQDFIDSIKAAWDSLVNGVLKLVPQFKKIFNIIIKIVKDFFKATFAFVLDMAKVFSGVWDIIKGIFTGNFDLILNGFSKIGDGIMGIFKTMGNFIIKIFDNILEMMNPIK